MKKIEDIRILTVFLLLILSLLKNIYAVEQPINSELIEFKFRLATDPPTLDPALSTDTTSGAVVLKIFDGLVQFDPQTMHVIPAVADHYDISEDGRTYTFYLRKNILFHNGRNVTAEDVKYSFERTLDPRTKSPRTWVLDQIRGSDAFIKREAEDVEGIEIVNTYTVKIHLSEPFAPFLAQLCMEAASLVPREECERWGSDFKSHPVGCGPFKFVQWKRAVDIVLEANRDYYDGAPYIDRVRFKVIDNDATAFDVYKSGELDLLDQVPPGQIKRIQKDFPEHLRIWPYLSIYYIGFNHSKPPFKDNRLLRQAFNYAIDRSKICLAVKEGVSFPAAGIIPPGVPGYNPDLEGYSYDPDKARALMVQAGYPEGKGLPEIVLWHNRDPRHRLIGECIQYYLDQIGVKVTLKNVEWAAYLEACEEGRPLLYRMGWVADYPDADNFLYILLHSSQAGSAGNYARYSNKTFDELVEKAQKLSDMDERILLYQKAERIAVEDAAWIFVYYDREVALIKPFWDGIILSPQGDFTIPLKTIKRKAN
ncbi:ABC transporter substrate-binding protein [bacterium]|nr:ABC transporter substrate-binding protein [candidate division CSSED10-310 bacterium]